MVNKEHETLRMEITVVTPEGKRIVINSNEKPPCYGHLYRECRGCPLYKGCLTSSMEELMKVSQHCNEG
jgi:hypothetical protein